MKKLIAIVCLILCCSCSGSRIVVKQSGSTLQLALADVPITCEAKMQVEEQEEISSPPKEAIPMAFLPVLESAPKKKISCQDDSRYDQFKPERRPESRYSMPSGKQKKSSSWSLSILAGLGIGCFFASRLRGRRISQWASRNKWKGRSLIVTGHLILGGVAFIAGGQFADHKIFDLGTAAFAVSLGAITFYPIRKAKGNLFGHSWIKQKIFDSVLLLCGLVMMFCIGSQIVPTFKEYTTPIHEFTSAIESSEENQISPDNKAEDPNNAVFINQLLFFISVILSIAVFLVLFVLVFYISCNLSCSGQETLAWAFFIGGTLVSLLLLVLLIRFFKKRTIDKNPKKR